MKLTWSPRAQPLAVEGCWAEGPVADQLRAKIRHRGLKNLSADFEGGLVLLGEQIPWVESLTYLGREGQIYLPTLWSPDLPHEWLLAGLKKKGPGPWVLLPPGRVLGLP